MNEELKQRVRDQITKRPGLPDCRISDLLRTGAERKRSVTTQEVAAVRREMGLTQQPESDTTNSANGIVLGKTNVYVQQPQDRAKGLIYGLTKGRGFPVHEFAERWHMSEETLSKHAKRHDAMRYVELSPGHYVRCVLHPETAAKYKG